MGLFEKKENGESKNRSSLERDEYRLFKKRPYDGFEIQIKEENGNKRLERVYVADYHVPDAPAAMKRAKVIYCVLYLLAAVAAFIAMLAESPSNRVVYVFLPEALSFIIFIVLLVSVVSFAKAKERLTIGRHRRASVCLIRYAFAQAILLSAALISTMIHIFTGAGDDSSFFSAQKAVKAPVNFGVSGDTAQIICAVLFFVGAVMLYAMAFMEKGRKYHTEAPEGKEA